VETLLGNPAKAAAKLGWKPEISFKDTWPNQTVAFVVKMLRGWLSFTNIGFLNVSHRYIEVV